VKQARTEDTEHDHGACFWAATVLGGSIIAFGIRGALHDAAATGPVDFFAWLVGADLVHDLLIAPAVCTIGVVVARTLPRVVRVPLQSGLVMSALVLIVAWPGLRGYGRDQVPDNPTVHPLDYTSAVLTVLGAVWLGVAIWIVWRIRVGRRDES
jgi:hypothetical protein